MSTDTEKQPLADRLLRTGLSNGLAFGGVFLAVRGFSEGAPDGTNTINLALVLTNVLPIGLVCAAALIVIGGVMKLRQRSPG